MTESQTQENSPETVQGSQPLGSAGQSPAGSQATNDPPARPAWVSDEFYDPSRGVKLDELGARFKELSEYKSARDAEMQARAQDIPESAEGYGEILKEAKLAEGFSLNEESGMWKRFKEFSHENKLTKSEFSKFLNFYADVAVAEQKQFIDGIEAQKKALFAELGDNGSQRIDAVKQYFKNAFGEKVAAQMQETLYTPDIVKTWEKIQRALTAQGVTSFNGMGRDGAGGGDIEGWDKMTFEQRWAARSQQDRRAS